MGEQRQLGIRASRRGLFVTPPHDWRALGGGLERVRCAGVVRTQGASAHMGVFPRGVVDGQQTRDGARTEGDCLGLGPRWICRTDRLPAAGLGDDDRRGVAISCCCAESVQGGRGLAALGRWRRLGHMTWWEPMKRRRSANGDDGMGRHNTSAWGFALFVIVSSESRAHSQCRHNGRRPSADPESRLRPVQQRP